MTSAAVLLAALSAAPAAAAPDVYGALPGGDGVRLEAALVVADARGLHDRSMALLEPLLRTEVGRAWREASEGAELMGVALHREWQRLAALAHPEGGPTPMALAVFSRGEDVAVQALLHVAPGFEERAGAEVAGERPPFWSVQSLGGGLAFQAFDTTVHGRIDAGGWLRLGTDPTALVDGRGPGALLEGPLDARVRGADVALLVVGGGRIAQGLSEGMDPSPASAMVAGLRGLALTLSVAASGTYDLALSLDAPVLGLLGPSPRRPDLSDALVHRWDGDATGFLAVSAPPTVLKAAGPLLREFAGEGPVPPPDVLVAALSRLEGHMGLVSYGAPGDFGLAVQFEDPAAAQDAVRGVHGWLRALVDLRPTTAAQTLRLDLTEVAGQGPVLRVSPDVAVEGMRVFASGPTLLVAGQAARHEALARPGPESGRGGDGGGPGRGVLEGPLTPEMRDLLATPAVLVGYTVLGTHAAAFDWLAWLAKAGEIGLEIGAAELPALPPGLHTFLRRAGAATVAVGFMTMMLYDGAIALDVNDGVASLRLAASLL